MRIIIILKNCDQTESEGCFGGGWGVVLNPGKYCSATYLLCAEPVGGEGGGGDLYGACT